MDDTRCVNRDSAGYCILSIIRAHAGGRHKNHLVGVDHTGHMHLCAADNDTLVILFNNMDEHIRIFLLVRLLASVTLGICHGACNHQVLFLPAL